MKKSKKKKLRKEAKIVKLHQHKRIDEYGDIVVFGFSHPVEAAHKNVKTQKVHDETVRLENAAPNFVKKSKEWRDDSYV
ncbi:unnamed protein product [marine sediment metagenome]|uniref:Uncharacterized protein n=1 Tax=marine sediment metagenome TaxID=412755 RepID=X0XJG6_9ZZZZ